MIIISQDNLNRAVSQKGEMEFKITFYSLDDRDVLIDNSLFFSEKKAEEKVEGIIVKNLPSFSTQKKHAIVHISQLESGFELSGWIFVKNTWVKSEISVIKWKEALFSRLKGLFETDVLREKRVSIVGLGSGGAPIAIELAKAGVGVFSLIDADRLEVENIVRHSCGISDLGRYKTKAVKDLLLEKNPNLIIETHEIMCNLDTQFFIQSVIRSSDLVLCCTDNRESRIIINAMCVKENKTCIYGGTFERAYGGQALRVIPNKTMCYQCFVDIMPAMEANQEISNPEQANQIAYSDHLVPIEPGLSNDIVPISSMCVKLALLELLKDEKTTFSNQYEDLKFNWYMWLNRREVGTEYEDLPSLDNAMGDMRILAWYGVENEKNPTCPICGDFYSKSPSARNNITDFDIASFGIE